MAANKRINFSKSVKYSNETQEYTLQLVHHRKPWWLLLLLLPLLLFIKCHKDISVSCYEPDTNAPISDVPVNMNYHAHYLWDNGRFLATDSINKIQKTDSLGQTVFKDLPCSVFSYVFYCLSQVSFTAKSGCHAASDEKHNFHFTRHVDLLMAPRTEDLHIKLLDLETGDPLPDGTLIYQYVELGEVKTDSAHADASGVATMPKMRYCSVMKMVEGECYGYADTSRVDIPCQNLLVANDSMALRLRPIKERFTFFVKNKETKEPIPAAECMITLTSPSGKSTKHGPIHTSTDGKGIAVYDSAFVLSKIDIVASKQHYKDGKLAKGPWTVDKFIKQDNDTRTIWLEPEPYLVEFVIVDSISGKPIPGVENEITITDASGRTEKIKEISNKNGVIPISAKEGSKVDIISTKEPVYKKKTTIIDKFRDKEVIRMMPNMETCHFRTLRAIDNKLLPQCNLSIHGTVSGNLSPINYSNGEFDVMARLDDNISITASKAGFKPNSTSVRNASFAILRQSSQSKRDIPLQVAPFAVSNDDHRSGRSQDCYDLNVAPCDFTFMWNVCNVCTMLIVSDANGNILGRFGVDSPKGDGIGIRYSAPSGKVVLHTNTQEICVTRICVNGDLCSYSIIRN